MTEDGLERIATGLLPERYTMQETLTSSDEGGTLLAIDHTTQAQVVIKVLIDSSHGELSNTQRFQREAETLKRLNHPSISGYLDYFEVELPEGTGFALVQPYIAGKTLQEYWNEKRLLSEAEAQDIAIAILNTLVYLHKHQPPIIHRDISPSSILITSQPDKFIDQIYLTDFSSAQNFLTSTIGSFTVVGTYGYTPPEQLSGRPVPASDLYSLGVTLITLMTGIEPAKLPHKGRQLIFESVLTGSPAFAHWLRQMTEPGLDKRFTSAQSALHTLKHHLVNPPAIPQKPTFSKVAIQRQANSLEVIIPTAIGKIRLQIDDRQLRLINERMGWKFSRTVTARRQDLRRLECARHQLVICTASQRYELGNGHLTEPEVHWLAYELSQWLKVPAVKG